jgi:thioredoxin-like negative regulator of GroEL
VDCTENSAVAGRFGIQGYPTLLLLDQGKLYKYTGSRKLEDLMEFALVRATVRATELVTMATHAARVCCLHRTTRATSSRLCLRRRRSWTT